jgi:error-prone DNA polymerase
MSFAHLHCHSVWSLLDGAIPAEALPHIASTLGQEAIAMTDTNSLTGAVRFTKACADAGVKPIYGAELTLRRHHKKQAKSQTRKETVTLIARDRTGYANLCRLISASHLSNERGDPAINLDAIAARSEGLFVLSGGIKGEVARLAAAGAVPRAIEAARKWKKAIGEGYRIEIFDHRGYGHRTLRDRLLKVAAEAGVTPVVTNDVHYALPDHAPTHDIMRAIGEIVPVARARAQRSTSEAYLKDSREMRALFEDVPEAIDEAMRIAEACDFELDLGAYHFPVRSSSSGRGRPTAPGDANRAVGSARRSDENGMSELARRCYEGARRRYGRIPDEIEARLQHELGYIYRGGGIEARTRAGRRDINTHGGYASYFLLVADIVDHVRNDLGIWCTCRGSAAGSLVCYVLGISDVDPVRYDLLFERFMNDRREELPDIDVDVESHRREEVLAYILDKFGPRQTAVCCMVDTFRARMAIRDIGKALGLPAEEIDMVAKAFPRVAAREIPRAIEMLPELSGSNLDAGQLKELFDLCVEVDGFPRHLALHPSGVILSSDDLADRVPMQESYQGFTMLQADKDDVEELGLVKLDILGVRMLSAIAHARTEIERTRGAKPDLDSLIPFDDAETYDAASSSNTMGCFQIESPGQRELLARLQPRTFEDLIVEISLFRPGPVQSDMVSPYLEARHGFREVSYMHPSLKEILAETNGIIVFHEQLIRVISTVTGCSLDDADYIRRHLDSERPSLPDDPDSRPARKGIDGPRSGVPAENRVGEWFISSAIRNGHSPQQARTLWKEVFAFASFGFCKSHAAAFALPTYISTYFKTHYPAEFVAGLLTHDPGMYPRRTIVSDARVNGIPILPIDINQSDAVYRAEPVQLPEKNGAGAGRLGEMPEQNGTPEQAGVRLALSEVRDISEAEVDSILKGRIPGPYRSLEDLWRRSDLSRPVLENLVHVGALDSVESARSRRELLWRAAELAAEPKSRPGLQLSLRLDEPIGPVLPELPAYTPLEETEAELEVSGIDARKHLMEHYQTLTEGIPCVMHKDLKTAKNRSYVWVAGVKVSSQTPAIRSGQRIIFVTIEDTSGPIEVTVFERAQARCAHTVFHSWLLLVRGELRKRGGASRRHKMHPDNVGVTVVAEEVYDLAEIAGDIKTGLSFEDAIGRQRARQEALLPAPAAANEAPARLWHSSGGSAGR